MTRLYIPPLGDLITLEKDWEFTLHSEYRNSEFWDAIVGPRGYDPKNPPCILVTLPKGSILKMDRIYIRKGAGDYDSVTFWLTDCPNKAWAPKKVGGTATFKGRFWVKLEDANKMIINV